MERFLQYLDDVDDLYGMFGLINERLRHLFFALLSCLSLGVVGLSGIWLALVNPSVALATSFLLFVTLLHRSVITSPDSPAHTA